MAEQMEIQFNKPQPKTLTIAERIALGLEVKLDLACGQTPREGFIGVDAYAPGVEKVDLMKFPFPWPDNSVDEIHCSHFLEHLPCRDVEDKDILDPSVADKYVGKDFLFAFMDECYRVLKPRKGPDAGASMTAIVPSGKSSRGFQDPTHRRFFVHASFLYFNAEWRKANRLDHYRANCNFGVDIRHTCMEELAKRSPEYQAMAYQNYWDQIIDLHAILIKL